MSQKKSVFIFKTYLGALLCCLMLGAFQPSFAANKVELSGGPGNWKLMLNGKEFFVKGLCWGPKLDKENEDYYFGLVKDLGANTVRVWGIGSETQELMDALAKHGVMIDLGIWLQQYGWVSYAKDDEYKEKTLKEIEENVLKFKDHPALLMWNIGNEVIFTLKTEEEKIAFAEYLEQICQRVHQLDPDHPITYASAWALDFPPFKKYTPSLDIYGTNCYNAGAVLSAVEELKKLGVDRPYLVTEFGNPGDFEAPKDGNGQALDISDTEKARAYTEIWQKGILANKGKNCIGGFAFIFADNRDSIPDSGGIWYNLLIDGKKRASYWAVREAFTGQKAENLPPKIEKFMIGKASGLQPGEKVTVQVIASSQQAGALSCEFRISGLPESGNRVVKLDSLKRAGNNFVIKAPLKEGVYRIYAYVSDDNGNLAILAKSIKVGP